MEIQRKGECRKTNEAESEIPLLHGLSLTSISVFCDGLEMIQIYEKETNEKNPFASIGDILLFQKHKIRTNPCFPQASQPAKEY